MKREELEKQRVRENGHWWFETRRALLTYGFERAAPGETLEILEVGAATGGNDQICSRFGRYTALDLSDAALGICRSRGVKRLVRGDGQTLPFASGTFDVIVMFDILEHLSEDEASLREARRILRPGGTLLANVPAFQRLFSEHDISFDHVRRYQPGELQAKLRRAGFETIFRSYWSCIIFPAVFVIRTLSRKSSGKMASRSDFDRPMPLFVAMIPKILAYVELFLIRHNVSLPFGVSYCCFARKPVDA